jgi:myo-inositol-1(or 4)-monophosphatase
VSDRALAERLVRLAGGLALELRGGAVEIKDGATDVVTAADREAEAAQVALLRGERPSDAVVGEEGAAVAPSGLRPRAQAGGERRWLLDPVDGTLNYARGIPPWCSAVALLDAEGAAAAAVYDPVGDELFSAARGAGATVNGAPLGVARAPALVDGVVATFVDIRRRDADVIARTEGLLRRVGALRAVGCGSLELAWLAAGRLDGWVQADVEPWDWHPGALLVAEAGGVARVAGRWRVAAASGSLGDELLASLQPDP